MRGNAAALVWDAADRWPERVAVIDGGTQVDYRGLAGRAAAYAGLLADAGVTPGDRVAILFRRTWDAAAAFFGVLAAGGVAVVVADVLRPRQIEHVVTHSGAKLLLLGPGIPDATTPDLPATVLSVLRQTASGQPDTLQDAQAQRACEAVELPATPSGAPRPAISPVVERDDGDLAQLIYTSGSTGRPKGVMISHGNLWAGVEAVRSYLGIRADDRIASLLPFSFDYGLNQLLVAVASGATLVIERSPVAARIDLTLRAARVTVAAGVPALWHQLLGVERFRDEPIETLRLVTNSGGHLAPEVVKQLRESQPQAAPYLMYGLTEAFRSTYLASELVDAKPGSVGKAIPGADVRVVRPDGSVCAPFEVGEIIHRGPTVGLGYWNDPAATAQVFLPAAGIDWAVGGPHDHDPPGSVSQAAAAVEASGEPHPDHAETTAQVAGLGPQCADGSGERVVYSGDLGWTDEDGDLYVHGRRDAMIKRLGFRVSPDEVTESLIASGLVREACVTAAPSEAEGAEITAHVVLEAGAAPADVECHVALELPRHLRPSQVVAYPRLPTTPNGKYDLQALAAGSHPPDAQDPPAPHAAQEDAR